MIRINLLPKEYLHKRKNSAIRVLISLALGAVGAIITLIGAFMYFNAYFELNSLKSEKVNIDQRIIELSTTVQRVKELEQVQTELASKQTYQQQLTGQKVKWSLVLRDFSQLVPDGVWIDNMTVDNNGVMNIQGTTFAYESVAEFMVKLKSTGRFTNVDFSTAQAGELAEQNVVKFNITSQLNKGSDKS